MFVGPAKPLKWATVVRAEGGGGVRRRGSGGRGGGFGRSGGGAAQIAEYGPAAMGYHWGFGGGGGASAAAKTSGLAYYDKST